jgi:hypothetical protein
MHPRPSDARQFRRCGLFRGGRGGRFADVGDQSGRIQYPAQRLDALGRLRRDGVRNQDAYRALLLGVQPGLRVIVARRVGARRVGARRVGARRDGRHAEHRAASEPRTPGPRLHEPAPEAIKDMDFAKPSSGPDRGR